MRKVVVAEFLTLDGVMEDPHKWSFDFWSDEMGQYKHDELFATDALLLGRVTYEVFAEAWPSRTDETGFADRFNSIPKYVVSTTLGKAEWNNSTIIRGNLAEEIRKLKEQPGQDIAVHGSGTLVRSLAELDLVDEYHLMIYPILLGSGKRLFNEESDKKVLNLVDTKPLPHGAIVLTYQPARAD